MRRLLPTAPFFFRARRVAVLWLVAALAMSPLPATADPVPYEPTVAPERSPPGLAGFVDSIARTVVFRVPILGRAITSVFGLRRLPGQKARPHKGVDIAAPQGTAVLVSAEGTVRRTGYDVDGYGRFIEVAHLYGMSTLYGHLSRVDVAAGDRTLAGERIGLVGSTGRSSGPHLHFEVRRDGVQVNPETVLGRA